MKATRGMTWVRMMAVVALLPALAAGCGWFRSKTATQPPTAEAPAPVPTPAAPEAPPASPPPPSVSVPPARPPEGRIADEAALSGLVQGKTTKADVRDVFGMPQEIVLSPGVETFLYYRDRASRFWRSSERVEMLTIRFDASGILKDFEYRYSGK